MKIAIIGGGGSGLACAWLLEQHHDVTLFEADDRLGGHADTVEVEVDGERLAVDAGFQFFGPGRTYRRFNRLLDALAVPRRSYRATMTLSRSHRDQNVVLPPFRRGAPVWSSFTPSALYDLVLFRHFLKPIPEWLAQHDTTVTIADYIESRRMPRRFTEGFLYPFLLALWCVEPDEFRGFAAYNCLFYLGDTLSDGFHPPVQLEIDGGMKAYVDALVRDLECADLRVSAAVQSLARAGDGWEVVDVTGFRATFDHVVVATDAEQAHRLLAPVAGLDDVSRQLARIEYFDTTIAIHGDSALMPRRASAWSVVNTRWDGVHSQLTVWSPERARPVFKSWVTFDERMPQPLFATATYRHPKVTVAHFDAQRELTALQGRDRLWLAGIYTHDADSHESAIGSAIAVAERLAPDSARLKTLLA